MHVFPENWWPHLTFALFHAARLHAEERITFTLTHERCSRLHASTVFEVALGYKFKCGQELGSSFNKPTHVRTPATSHCLCYQRTSLFLWGHSTMYSGTSSGQASARLAQKGPRPNIHHRTSPSLPQLSLPSTNPLSPAQGGSAASRQRFNNTKLSHVMLSCMDRGWELISGVF